MTAARALAPALLAGALLAGCAGGPSATSTPVAESPPPTLPAATAAPPPSAAASPAPAERSMPAVSPTPVPTASPTSAPTPAPPTRVAIAALAIDLPVVAPPRGSTWPLCDVAEFFAPPVFDLPGAGGVTYVYAHAQEGMFLPILLASRRNGGRALVGEEVGVWTAANRRFTYRITEVRRAQKTLDWAFSLPAGSLVLQTSENQYRTGSKVMLVARQEGSPAPATPEEAQPTPRPRRCGP